MVLHLQAQGLEEGDEHLPALSCEYGELYRDVVCCQLQQAKRAFAMQARGPACERYLEELEQECEQLWKNGRQMCEEISLTGSHCVNEVSTHISSVFLLPFYVFTGITLFVC